jgi:hypothetical protein
MIWEGGQNKVMQNMWLKFIVCMNENVIMRYILQNILEGGMYWSLYILVLAAAILYSSLILQFEEIVCLFWCLSYEHFIYYSLGKPYEDLLWIRDWKIYLRNSNGHITQSFPKLETENLLVFPLSVAVLQFTKRWN